MTAKPATTIITAVNINDPDALKAVVKEEHTSDASKADRIASATKRAITEKMDEDPPFYRQFSEAAARNDLRVSGEAYFGKGLPEECR